MIKFFEFILKTILSIIALYVIYFIWTNQEELITLAYNTFQADKDIEIIESNDNKRYYSYSLYNTDEDFIPEDYSDLKNIIYNFLNNGWTDFTFYCADDYSSCVDDIKEISKDASLLSSINNYVSPFNSFSNFYTKITTDGTITLNIKKTYDEAMVESINSKINSIIDELNLGNYNDTDKIKIIHNYLIKYVDYDKRENYELYNSNNAYGALFNSLAICSGYADAMALFLDKLNIPNFKVSSENHVWNMVLINGEWKHIDVTWDDPINASILYNKYTYFLIDTDELLKLDKTEHNFNIDYYPELKEGN